MHCNFSIPELEPRLFSFNSPYGACPECKGLGTKLKISENLILPNKDKSLNQNALLGFTIDNNTNYTTVKTVCDLYDIDMDMPVKDIPKDKLKILLYGSKEPIEFKYVAKNGNVRYKNDYFEGAIPNLERRYMETTSAWTREWLETFMVEMDCPVCHGTAGSKLGKSESA